ncbi:MAG: hypothetical protein M1327_05175 [Candidatus Thermoplasmatota archaeon]|nr:hypothetical protein [Candidatus Thermoplasmatota archaeon]
MPENDDVAQKIKNARKVSDRGDLVVYNLASGIDFSDPDKVARALADVFFNEDAAKWFNLDGDHLTFNPEYKVRILLSDEHGKTLERAVDDFLLDLKKDELDNVFSSYIKDTSEKAQKLQAAMARHSFGSFLNKRFNRKVEDVEVEDDLFTDLLEAIEIRSPTNQDLMDWKNLPI